MLSSDHPKCMKWEVHTLSKHRAILLSIAAAFVSMPAVAGESQPATATNAQPQPAQSPLGPTVGEKAPGGELLTKSGTPFALESAYANGPVVIIFYRGSWCPYCTRSLRAWGDKLQSFKDAGATVIAISPEKFGYAAEMTNLNELEFAAYSDAKGDVCRNFKLQFALSNDVKAKYKGYRIDLSERNSDGQWTLPHPATILVDNGGIVRNVWVDEDYTKRVDPELVLTALAQLPK